MPYGHIRQYLELAEESQRKRIEIAERQRRQIAKLYSDIANEFGHELHKHDKTTLTYRWLKDYAKSLKYRSKELYNDLQGIVKKGILDTAEAVTQSEVAFWSSLDKSVSERFKDVFSTIPQECADELMSGGIYKDFTGLSERLWNYKKQFDTDIGYIIQRGIIEKKSALELSRDLELYLKPDARKPWEWKKVYPKSKEMVDYSAQRLSRTSITHAYQMAFVRSTEDNPFIEKYKWHSSNNGGRTCDLCKERDGKLFEKYSVPLDHPNGMCVMTAVITKSYEEIVDELTAWSNRTDNPALDRWLGENNLEGDITEKVYLLSHPELRKQLNTFDRKLRLSENQEVKTLLKQAKERVLFRKSPDKRSRYNAAENIIYLSEDAPSDTVAHELFHEIDVINNITRGGALSDSLWADYRRLSLMVEDGKTIPDMLYSKYPEAFESDSEKLKLLIEYRGVSDILNGLSEGEIWLGFGHSKKYWKVPEKLEAESWAQIGRILFSGNHEVIEMLKGILPGLYSEAMGIIERMV